MSKHAYLKFTGYLVQSDIANFSRLFASNTFHAFDDDYELNLIMLNLNGI